MSTPAPPTQRPSKASKASATSSTQTQTQTAAPSNAHNEPLPPAHPVPTLATPLAQAASHTHTAALPLLFAARFGATVADPVSSLAALLAPVAALQAAYCVLCLPPTDNSDAFPAAAGGARRKPGGGAKDRGRVVPALLSLILTVLVSPLLFALLVLHGAPLTTHHAHTALFALHVALLTAPPLFYTHGVRAIPWRQLVSLAAPFDAPRGAAAGALLGAWLGAVPIPLDWDREWQKWPVTVVTGAYAGWAVGKLVGGTLGYGRVINFD